MEALTALTNLLPENPLSFVSVQFALFLAVTAAGYYLLPQKLYRGWLLIASVYFYLSQSPQFGIWLALDTLVAYAAARVIARCKNDRARRAALLLAAAVIAGLLCMFKYFDSAALLVAQLLGRADAPTLGIAVPIGISYYTFTVLGYLIDVRRGDCEAERNFVDFAAYVTFFPHILLGPIARTGSLLPQFREKHRFETANLAAGAQRFLWGMAKKLLVADWLGTFVDTFYNHYADDNPLCIFAAVLLYGLQLYFDFSGFCDMALGAARILGFRLQENFAAPYFSHSITELWSRWHISLTDWLRRYVYFPLGGSRRGYGRKLLNILIVFAVSGLWHGDTLLFLLWGLAHGMVRVAEDLWRTHGPKLRRQPSGFARRILSALKTVYAYVVWCLVFVLFRAPSFEIAGTMLRRFFAFGEFSVTALYTRILIIMRSIVASSNGYIKLNLLIIALVFFLVMALEHRFVYRAGLRDGIPDGNVLAPLPEAGRWAVILFLVAALLCFGWFGSSSFIYFQF